MLSPGIAGLPIDVLSPEVAGLPMDMLSPGVADLPTYVLSPGVAGLPTDIDECSDFLDVTDIFSEAGTGDVCSTDEAFDFLDLVDEAFDILWERLAGVGED